MPNISRRQFLQSAGGITFLALTPLGRSLFAAPGDRAKMPLFTALPYVQPGANSKLVENAETFVIAWQTENKAADFRCEYGTTERYGKSAPIEQTSLWAGNEEKDKRIHYSAHPTKLKLGTRYYYRVWCNGEELFAGYLTTRQPRGARIRFATFGDNSYGGDADRAIAFRAYEQHPDFIMNTGDNVYDGGRNGEYEDHWFPIYNNDKASPATGAPLLRSVPFYTVLANHDVRDQKPGGGPCANFDRERDYLAYYTAMHLPMNGPNPAFPRPASATKRASQISSARRARVIHAWRTIPTITVTPIFVFGFQCLPRSERRRYDSMDRKRFKINRRDMEIRDLSSSGL